MAGIFEVGFIKKQNISCGTAKRQLENASRVQVIAQLKFPKNYTYNFQAWGGSQNLQSMPDCVF